MDHSAQHRQSASPLNSFASRGPLIAIAAATCILAGAAVGAAPSTAQTPVAAHTASSICSHVSAQSISAIVGFTVPAPTFSTLDLPASKKNDEIGTKTSVCTYGAAKSLAELQKVVILDVGVTTKPVTESEIQANVVKVEKASGAKFKISSYSGLGAPAYYMVLTIGGIPEQTIAAVSGTHDFAASMDSSKVSESELGKLAALAEKL
jgi:hypothetical protein